SLRNGGGCTDTDNNDTDFSVGVPNPRNTTSSFNVCATPTPSDTPPVVNTATSTDTLTSVPTDTQPDTPSATPTPTNTATATDMPTMTHTPTATLTPPNHIVISQVYGGGGNSGAAYKNDFIELFNPANV